MSENLKIDWQTLYRHRQLIREQFGDVWKLPIRKRYDQVLSLCGSSGVSLLEVGAGDRRLRKKMAGYWGQFDYRSFDIDSTYHHDFTTLDEVDGIYDLICAFEVIEHLGLEEAAHMLAKLRLHLKPGGRLVLTTPNIFYPPAFMRDATHLTPFCYDELGGLTSMVGYRVQSIYRLYHDSLLKKFVRRVLMYSLFRLIGIDFAKQVAVIAVNPR